MNKKWRRYEVLLPARFNDGSDVSEELLGQAVDEVMASFSGATYYKEAATGYWRRQQFHDGAHLTAQQISIRKVLGQRYHIQEVHELSLSR